MAACAIKGEPGLYVTSSWLWSDQSGLKLQPVGR
jgi:hypothetical protein